MVAKNCQKAVSCKVPAEVYQLIWFKFRVPSLDPHQNIAEFKMSKQEIYQQRF